MNNNPIFTYQTRVEIHGLATKVLVKTAELLSHVERCLFADYAKGKSLLNLKSEYLKKHGITARQYNAIRILLEGKIDSIIKLREDHLRRLQELIKKVASKLAALEKKRKDFLILRNKKNQLQRLEKKLANLKSDKDRGKVRLCFGSQKLFHAQYHLEENGYKSHEEWKKAWTKSRNSSFFCLGSKDESSGNQTCQARACEDGTITLTLRIPNALIEAYGKYLMIEKVHFAYGHEVILEALKNSQKRQLLKNAKDPSYLLYGQAISFRFKQGEDNKWYIFASTSQSAPEKCTTQGNGSIGIDINADHIALVEIDRMGNPIHQKSFSINAYKKNSHQTEAILGDIATLVVEHAKKTGKPLVLEDLDFAKKKESLSDYTNPAYARMLSSFFYGKTIAMIQSRGYRQGVEVLSVNPAFTSVIGRIKYAVRYGLTLHQAAALCIGRRGIGVSEKLVCRWDHIPDGKGNYIALTPPERKRDKYKWSSLKLISKKLLAKLRAHCWAIKKESILKAAARPA